MILNNLFINKKVWNKFTNDEHKEYVEAVYNHYRKNGFPYFPTDKNYRIKEYKKLRNYDFKKCIDYNNKVIKQTMHGLGLAWSYMPYSWKVVCNNKKTPMEVFNDDILFRKVIEKRMKMGDNISDNGIRKMLKIFTGTQSVSNFRPTASASIYSLFTSSGDIVWDMSSGYGGRLLGASLLDIEYVGTEPCKKTFVGLNKMVDDFNFNAKIHCIGSEDFKPDKESLDFCFTSPPYFDQEKYSEEDTQSYIKYPTIDLWVNGFIRKTFENCYHGLKNNKYMVINIANVKKYDIESNIIEIAKEIGFSLEGKWKLALSSINKTGFKYEPIYVFKKEKI